MPGCLALDLSARVLGWACDAGGNAPLYGRLGLPGMKSLGKLYAAVRNGLCDLIERLSPERMVWCRAEILDHERVTAAHQAVRDIAELVAFDHAITAQWASLRDARIAVLGRGDFGEIDPRTGGFVPGAGRRMAKDAVFAWCGERGFDVRDIESGNAIVLHRYCQLARSGGGSGRLDHHHPRGDARQAARPGGRPR